MGNGDGGNIRINARDQVEVIGSNSPEATPASTISSGTTLTATGAGGNINITVSNGELRLLNGGRITASAGAGKGGDIEISANAIEVVDLTPFADNVVGLRLSSTISSSSINGTGEPVVLGDAGNITIWTNQLSIREGASINADTSGQGRGGNIRIGPRNPNASSSIEISGVVRPSASLLLNSSLTTNTSGVNRAGDVVITTDRLILRNGGRISLDTTGAGRAGDVIINATDVELAGLSSGRLSSLSTGSFLSTDSAASNAESTGRAGNITVTTDRLRLRDGAQLSSTAAGRGEGGIVRITANEEIEIFGTGTTQFGTVSSAIQASASQDAQRAGDIVITTDRLTVSDSGAILADTSGAGRGGNIQIDANSIRLDGTTTGTNGILRSTLTTATSGAGRAGNIQLNAQSLQIRDGAGIFANTVSAGDGGNIRIQADSIEIAGAARGQRNIVSAISTEVGNRNATGNAGDVQIRGDWLRVRERGTVSSGTSGRGNAGEISIQTRDGVTLSRGFINSQVFAGGTGDSNNIRIQTEDLNITNGGQVAAAVSRSQRDAQGTLLPAGRGRGGNITVRASDSIRISGIGPEGFSSGILTLTEREAEGRAGNITLSTDDFQIADGGLVIASSFNNSPAGEITITADTLEAINGGQIITSARQAGNAGDVRLNINNDIRISGTYSNLENRLERIDRYVRNNPFERRSDVLLSRETASGIFANTANRSRARGGVIEVNANNLRLDNGARISAQSQGGGRAGDINLQIDGTFRAEDSDISTNANRSAGGNIQIRGGDIDLRASSNIRTDVDRGSGDGGDITVNADAVRLQNDSDIQTRVGENGEGDGGDIAITADSIIAFDDSDIITEAPNRGGNITLNTPAFFGAGYQQDAFTTSTSDGNGRVDLDASGTVSAGTVTTPDTSFIENTLSDLPTNAINTDQLLANSCIARSETGGTFLITGSGGLPERPGQAQIPAYPTGEVRAIPAEAPSDRNWKPGDPIVEPQGVYRLPDGRLVMSRDCQ